MSRKGEFQDWFDLQYGYTKTRMTTTQIREMRSAVDAGERAETLLQMETVKDAVRCAARSAWNAGYDAGRKSVK